MQTKPQIDWSRIQTILLDMDGTLLDLHFDNHFWREYLPEVYALENDVSQTKAIEILYSLFVETSGTLDWYCVNFWSDKLKLDIMQLKRDVAHKIAYRPQAQSFLEHCQSQSKDVRLVTNAHRQVLNLKIEHTQLDRYFKTMVCSHELDAPKEQLSFWENLQTNEAFDPSTTLFIDDSESVLKMADEFGIEHLYSIESPDSQTNREAPSAYPMLGVFETS